MTRPPTTGTLHVVGVGPGDPELLTLRAVRILGSVPAYAYFAKHGQPGHARTLAAPFLSPNAAALRFEYPYTTEMPVTDARYPAAMAALYDQAAAALAERLDTGADVAMLCEGDPFFYGSAMYVFDRLRARYPTDVTPGVTGMSGAWASARLPMTQGDDVLTILPGTMDGPALAERLRQTDAAVIMKLGSNMPKITAALHAAGRAADAVYVERATMPAERIAALPDGPAPYFSLVLVPGRQGPR